MLDDITSGSVMTEGTSDAPSCLGSCDVTVQQAVVAGVAVFLMVCVGSVTRQCFQHAQQFNMLLVLALSVMLVVRVAAV